MSREKKLILSGLLLSGIMAISFDNAFDRATWLLEVAPVLIALPLLAATYRRFPLTGLLYGLIFVHALVLIVGGTYTYARVPFGFWMQDVLALGRQQFSIQKIPLRQQSIGECHLPLQIDESNCK